MSITETLKKKISGRKKAEEKADSVVLSKSASEKTKQPEGPLEADKKTYALVLKKPRITEKASGLNNERIYTFDVDAKASKREVRRAVEGLYGVNTVSVRTITIHSKKRMRGRMEGWKKGYKKALVKIKEGQTIELGS